MASEFRKTRCIKIPDQPLLTIDPLSNLLLPLFSCSTFWRPLPIQPPEIPFFSTLWRPLPVQPQDVRFFSAFWSPLPAQSPDSHVLFNSLPAYSIENLFWN